MAARKKIRRPGGFCRVSRFTGREWKLPLSGDFAADVDGSGLHRFIAGLQPDAEEKSNYWADSQLKKQSSSNVPPYE